MSVVNEQLTSSITAAGQTSRRTFTLLLQDLSLTPGFAIVPSSDHERGAV